MNLKEKLFGDEEERAVSPVIGVILMVAITVILAAVIAAFVLDLGQSQSANVNAGANIDDSGEDEVVVQVTDMGNAENVRVELDNEGGSSGTGDPVISDFSDCSESSGTTCTLGGVGQQVTISDDVAEASLTLIAESGSNANVIQNYEA